MQVTMHTTEELQAAFAEQRRTIDAEIGRLREQLDHSGRERELFTAEIERLRAVND